MQERGMSQSPDYTGMYFWAFAPGAAHLSMPVSPWLVLQDEDSAWGAEPLRCKGITRRHTAGYRHTRFSRASRSRFGLGLPSLTTSEALLPLFRVTSNPNHNPKAKGYEVWTKQKRFSQCFCLWVRLSRTSLIPHIRPNKWKHLPLFPFPCFSWAYKMRHNLLLYSLLDCNTDSQVKRKRHLEALLVHIRKQHTWDLRAERTRGRA